MDCKEAVRKLKEASDPPAEATSAAGPASGAPVAGSLASAGTAAGAAPAAKAPGTARVPAAGAPAANSPPARAATKHRRRRRLLLGPAQGGILQAFALVEVKCGTPDLCAQKLITLMAKPDPQSRLQSQNAAADDSEGGFQSTVVDEMKGDKVDYDERKEPAASDEPKAEEKATEEPKTVTCKCDNPNGEPTSNGMQNAYRCEDGTSGFCPRDRETGDGQSCTKAQFDKADLAKACGGKEGKERGAGPEKSETKSASSPASSMAKKSRSLLAPKRGSNKSAKGGAAAAAPTSRGSPAAPPAKKKSRW